MTHQIEPPDPVRTAGAASAIGRGLGRVAPRPARRDQHRRVLVLEPAAGLRDQIDEHVLLIRQAAHHALILAHDLLDRRRRLRPIPNARLALVHQVVLLARDRELMHRRRTRQDRTIDQLIVVRRAEVVRPHFRHPGVRTVPSLRQLESHFVRTLRALLRQRQERRRSIERGEARLDEVRPHRQLARVHAVLDRDRAFAACLDPPAVLARLLPLARRREPLDVTRVLAHQIRSRCPDRHHQLDRLSAAGRHHGRDIDIMLRGIREAKGVLYGFHGLSKERAGKKSKGRKTHGLPTMVV